MSLLFEDFFINNLQSEHFEIHFSQSNIFDSNKSIQVFQYPYFDKESYILDDKEFSVCGRRSSIL